ncbi:hypothetical protein [Aquimarina sp. 2304DJ70-9]|uniref:hypothetical protein n=1 Tax=Aquimarina penaris TaxID=3231044 RepID=UPI0034618E45
MRMQILEARIKRNNFIGLAGKFYRDNKSSFIEKLNKGDNNALIAIEREDGVHTALGKEYVYYLTEQGVKGKLCYDDFLKILRSRTLNSGKKGSYEFIKVNEQDSIWVIDAPTMNAIWNTAMLIHGSK